MKPFGNHRVGLPTPIADILTDCFPVAPKSQSLSYGPAVALPVSEWPRDWKEQPWNIETACRETQNRSIL
jgi:hypothetical protein